MRSRSSVSANVRSTARASRELGEPLGGTVGGGAVVGMREAHEPAEARLHVVANDGHLGVQAEHLHRPAAVGRDAGPHVDERAAEARRTREEVAEVGSTVEQSLHTHSHRHAGLAAAWP